jgi:hypothetical protein
MTYITNPLRYDQGAFKTLVDGLKWDRGWTPLFPTLHNTGVPDLKTWMAWSPAAQLRWGANLNAYYKKLGWHSAVHLVCCPNYIWNLCDLEQDGVSVSCWNHLTIGIEMLGSYEKGHDDWSGEHGSKVRANAVWVLSVLCDKLHWDPGHFVQGKSGLHFHRECLQDHHACPGDQVEKQDMIDRVTTQIRALFNPMMGEE